VVGIKRFADEFLGHIWPVRVRGVDEINSEFGKTLQRPDGFCRSKGGPQMPGPVIRIAPKPRRGIFMSPPILNDPDLQAFNSSIGGSPWVSPGTRCGKLALVAVFAARQILQGTLVVSLSDVSGLTPDFPHRGLSFLGTAPPLVSVHEVLSWGRTWDAV